MNTFSTDKATTIRQPSTANIMIDSYDRKLGITASDFLIQKTNSIANGFFSRIGTTEVVLTWNVPNVVPLAPVIADTSGNRIEVDISGYSVQAITLPTGCYTVADVLDYLITEINDLSGSTGGFTFTASSTGGSFTLTGTSPWSFPITNNYLVGIIGFDLNATGAAGRTLSQTISTSNASGTYGALCQYRYLDFVSPELTYCQDVKDGSTSLIQKDVLCRWYFSDTDNLPQVDKYGFTIYMGYKPFSIRRIFNPPKQIKWDSNQPVGNLTFQVWAYPVITLDNTPVLIPYNKFEWQMTLQLSEN